VRASYYPGSEEQLWWHSLVQLGQGKDFLEIGAGSGKFPQNTNYPLGHVDGCDLDPRVLDNPFLKKAWIADFYDLRALEGNSYDVIYSHMVAEHVANPIEFLSQQLKLLKPDGVIIHSTLSRWSLPAVANRLLPKFLAKRVLGILRTKRSDDEVFKAFYQMNSKPQLRKIERELGVNCEGVFVSQPLGYFKFNLKLLTLVSILFSRLERIFPQVRSQLIVVVRKRK
jgi:SAM-dependent methyltransferase